eukprot:m.357767 g.357767  ORF g.357767 m.357767 type:complete len:464 (+) comp17937_c0_seq1:91-1482(+)
MLPRFQNEAGKAQPRITRKAILFMLCLAAFGFLLMQLLLSSNQSIRGVSERQHQRVVVIDDDALVNEMESIEVDVRADDEQPQSEHLQEQDEERNIEQQPQQQAQQQQQKQKQEQHHMEQFQGHQAEQRQKHKEQHKQERFKQQVKQPQMEQHHQAQDPNGKSALGGSALQHQGWASNAVLEQAIEKGSLHCQLTAAEWINVPLDAINDDFCDCTFDGLDEPGTSACEYRFSAQEIKDPQQGQLQQQQQLRKDIDKLTGFWCPVEHKYILLSRVADGVCDCCSGADEWQRDDVTCKDQCTELIQQRKANLAVAIQGNQIRKEMQTVEASGTKVDGHAWGGVDKALISLAKTCVSMQQNEYKYELCNLDSVKQHGSSVFTLGKGLPIFSYDEQRQTVSFILNGGDKCPNGKQRKTKVKLTCGVELELVQVSEPSACEYEMIIKGPVGCRDQVLEELKQAISVSM